MAKSQKWQKIEKSRKMPKNGKKSKKIEKNRKKWSKMPQNGKKSQKMVKNCQKCSKNAKKCFFFEMLRKSSKMPIKSAIFQKIKQTKINFAYTPKNRIIRIFSAPDGVLDGGKNPPHGRADRREGRGFAFGSPRPKSARTGQGRWRFGLKK